MTCGNMAKEAKMFFIQEEKPTTLFLLLKLITIENIIITQQLKDGIDYGKRIMCTLTDEILLTATNFFHICGNLLKNSKQNQPKFSITYTLTPSPNFDPQFV